MLLLLLLLLLLFLLSVTPSCFSVGGVNRGESAGRHVTSWSCHLVMSSGHVIWSCDLVM